MIDLTKYSRKLQGRATGQYGLDSVLKISAGARRPHRATADYGSHRTAASSVWLYSRKRTQSLTVPLYKEPMPAPSRHEIRHKKAA